MRPAALPLAVLRTDRGFRTGRLPTGTRSGAPNVSIEIGDGRHDLRPPVLQRIHEESLGEPQPTRRTLPTESLERFPRRLGKFRARGGSSVDPLLCEKVRAAVDHERAIDPRADWPGEDDLWMTHLLARLQFDGVVRTSR